MFVVSGWVEEAGGAVSIIPHRCDFQHELLWKNLAQVGQGMRTDLTEKVLKQPLHFLLDGRLSVWTTGCEELPDWRPRARIALFMP